MQPKTNKHFKILTDFQCTLSVFWGLHTAGVAGVFVFSLFMYLMAPIQLFTARGWGLWIRRSMRESLPHMRLTTDQEPCNERREEEQLCILGTTKGTSSGTMKKTRTGRGQCVFHRKVRITYSHDALNIPNISMLENRMSTLLHSSTDTVPCINLPWNLFYCFDNKVIS